jgi:hypothetical protein
VESGLVGLLASFREIRALEVKIEILSELLPREDFQACNAISVIMLVTRMREYVVGLRNVIGATKQLHTDAVCVESADKSFATSRPDWARKINRYRETVEKRTLMERASSGNEWSPSWW